MIRPLHIPRITRALDGYFNRDTPAKSDAVYVHQLQKKATRRGVQEPFPFANRWDYSYIQIRVSDFGLLAQRQQAVDLAVDLLVFEQVLFD